MCCRCEVRGDGRTRNLWRADIILVKRLNWTYIKGQLFVRTQCLLDKAPRKPKTAEPRWCLSLYVPGMLTELDAVMGPLSLASSMNSMVRYIRQGVDWLRLDSQKRNWPTSCWTPAKNKKETPQSCSSGFVHVVAFFRSHGHCLNPLVGGGGRFHTDHCTSSSSRLRRCLLFLSGTFMNFVFSSVTIRTFHASHSLPAALSDDDDVQWNQVLFFSGVIFSKFVWKDNKILPKVASSCSQFMRPYHAVSVQELAHILFSCHISAVNSSIMSGQSTCETTWVIVCGKESCLDISTHSVSPFQFDVSFWSGLGGFVDF